ncbi:PAS domain-containing sensor histidine kinase [Neorhizobium sp. P12A]|uniref:hybrid sensor histidine kinase/response regulator n=1 Tax=Neorhizobium sp. P12A TaxID=2268027 RepID=UPI0011EF0F63|nr:PAS domain-containing sensor histidine kinase [Neorhizobium sp. P12A]KAA0690984.1 PAS domain-containing sensor histidine kinase [Neorhizobium sp. P12A]
MNPTVAGLQQASTEGRYRILVDAITDYAIYLLDPEGYVSSWNPGAQRFKGYSEQEILGEHFSRFYTPEDRAAGIPAMALATAAREGRFEAEGWRVRKDGKRFWAHVIIDAVHDPRGQLVGFAKITRDLSERKATEEVLKRNQEQFRLLVQGVTDYAIYMLDPEGRVSSWNAGAQRIKGYAPDEIIGEHFSRFYTDEDKEKELPRNALETAAREGRFEREGWRVRKDGTRFWASVIIDAIHADDGNLIGFAKITRDVTEKCNAQEALDRAREELFQSQKMEAVGQLTGGIAHDFNNLLTAILGSLEIARKRVAEMPEVLGLIDNAMQGARRGASLTQRLLAFSRKQELKLELVDLQNLVKEMAELLQHSIGPAVEISTVFPLSLPLARTDPNQLGSALLNLVVNARDAMPRGGMITVSARKHVLDKGDVPDLPAGEYVCLSVRDEGEGMDAETLEKATTPFFTTKGIGKGTGLGLPMVQGVMAQSGGRLTLKSVRSQGTTAELWMPIADKQKVENPPAEQTSVDPVGPLTVLVVDDDSLVQMNTVLMLEDLGHATMQAQSGKEALEVLERGPVPDVLITDHAMPHMTGADLAREVASRYPNVRIVLATGYAELPDGAEVDAQRLSKPFNQRQLKAALATPVAIS